MERIPGAVPFTFSSTYHIMGRGRKNEGKQFILFKNRIALLTTAMDAAFPEAEKKASNKTQETNTTEKIFIL